MFFPCWQMGHDFIALTNPKRFSKSSVPSRALHSFDFLQFQQIMSASLAISEVVCGFGDRETLLAVEELNIGHFQR